MNNYADLLSIGAVSPADFGRLLNLAAAQRGSRRDYELAGKNIALIFEKPSLRTRVTFEVAIRQLGGWPILLGGAESRLGERESVPDLARNLSLWVDAIVARVFRHADLEELAHYATIPVVNALSDWEHPCQALADVLTLADFWPEFDGKLLVYVGDWNNVSRSLWKAAELAGMSFRAVCPAGYAPGADEAVLWSSDVAAVEGADAIYTDVWASMGQESETEARAAAFQPYQVNERLIERTGKRPYFMHCLPAHRGVEVVDAVIDSEYSLVFHQAANRLPAEKAILVSLLENHHEASGEEGRAGVLGRPGHIHNHSVAQGKLWM
ncbi:MAG TPA: ornithine carbamoyltransferase [Terriglobia bacterium]|nr:ornithine carbamoyltransferase [Terriglobia bacterium]